MCKIELSLICNPCLRKTKCVTTGDWQFQLKWFSYFHGMITVKVLERFKFLGPFGINGCPLRRISQRYVIGTATKIDLSEVKIPEHINDEYFKRIREKRAKKEEGDIFQTKKEVSNRTFSLGVNFWSFRSSLPVWNFQFYRIAFLQDFDDETSRKVRLASRLTFAECFNSLDYDRSLFFILKLALDILSLFFYFLRNFEIVIWENDCNPA